MHTEIDHPAETTQTCGVALKEWGVTCRALAQGRQIALLRKGGLLDADGVFHLEYSRFWLQPTFLHQDTALVKPEQRDLFDAMQQERATGEGRDFITLRWFARVEDVFALTDEDDEKLKAAPHIWSNGYLDTRFSYRPEHPLLCVLLRVYEAPRSVRLPVQPQWMGCRSWIELPQGLSTAQARPALDEAAWRRAHGEWCELLRHKS
jgi:hypothetical protein